MRRAILLPCCVNGGKGTRQSKRGLTMNATPEENQLAFIRAVVEIGNFYYLTSKTEKKKGEKNEKQEINKGLSSWNSGYRKE
jgi:hypothetical protein